MVWQREVDEINHRRQLTHQGGDPERIARQHAQGKLTIRERIAALTDPGSFHELGGPAGGHVDGVRVTGECTINGRKVVISGDDFTVRHDVPSRGGEEGYGRRSLGFSHAEVIALEWRLPYIRLLDAPGHSVKLYEITRRPEFTSHTQWVEVPAHLLSVAPVLSVIMGPAAGKPAVEVCLCHFNVMVKGTSQVFPGGPPVVKAALGYDTNKEELGGWRVATSSGMVDNVAENEREAFAIVRRFLSYLPSNVWEMPPRIEPSDDPNRRDDELLSVVPRDRNKPYNPYEILDHVLDHDSVFAIAPFYGTACITALARVNGYPVGVIINSPMSPSVGAMDVAAGEKVIRFLQLCDTFHLPIACFVDEPGFMIGREAQEQGIVRTAARVVQAIRQTKMPWISFIVRQVYGVGSSLAFRPGGMSERYAWPSALVGSMHIEAGAVPVHRMAGSFGVHDIVDPRDTRPLLCDFVEAAQVVLRTQLGPSDGPSYRL